MIKIYCINLDRRSDRWVDSQRNHVTVGLPHTSVQRLSAVDDRQYGALGCSKSHVSALAHFLTHESAPYCLIIEDDFDFHRPFAELEATLQLLSTDRLDWDVLMLMGTLVTAARTHSAHAMRVIDACTSAAYLVSRNYAPTLLACIAESIPQMELLRNFEPRSFLQDRLPLDVVWRRLQRRDRWYICAQPFGAQRTSYSDIQQATVNYDAQTFGLQPPRPPQAKKPL
jgi:glycosyl transferase, family 25